MRWIDKLKGMVTTLVGRPAYAGGISPFPEPDRQCQTTPFNVRVHRKPVNHDRYVGLTKLSYQHRDEDEQDRIYDTFSRELRKRARVGKNAKEVAREIGREMEISYAGLSVPLADDLSDELFNRYQKDKPGRIDEMFNQTAYESKKVSSKNWHTLATKHQLQIEEFILKQYEARIGTQRDKYEEKLALKGLTSLELNNNARTNMDAREALKRVLLNMEEELVLKLGDSHIKLKAELIDKVIDARRQGLSPTLDTKFSKSRWDALEKRYFGTNQSYRTFDST